MLSLHCLTVVLQPPETLCEFSAEQPLELLLELILPGPRPRHCWLTSNMGMKPLQFWKVVQWTQPSGASLRRLLRMFYALTAEGDDLGERARPGGEPGVHDN